MALLKFGLPLADVCFADISVIIIWFIIYINSAVNDEYSASQSSDARNGAEKVMKPIYK